jgi:hypothetical protein
MNSDFDECVRRHASLLNYGRYAMQLHQWLAYWDQAPVRVVRFEDYVDNRMQTLTDLCDFLGVGPFPATANFDAARNVSQDKPVLNTFWERVVSSGVYRATVRPWLPTTTRERLRRLVLPRSSSPPAPPRQETIDRLVAEFSPDAARLQQLTGRPTPYWDWEAVRKTHSARRQQWELSQLKKRILSRDERRHL